MFYHVVGLLLALLAPTVYSQLDTTTATAELVGTWSSGSKNVVTGPVSH
jgi:hypothetical protein